MPQRELTKSKKGGERRVRRYEPGQYAQGDDPAERASAKRSVEAKLIGDGQDRETALKSLGKNR
jgi:hypothetical protein